MTKHIDYRDGKWHPWTGGQCPVDPQDEVEIMCPSGSKITDTAKYLGWSHMDRISDAVAFRVVESKPDARQVVIQEVAMCMARTAVNHGRTCEELAAGLYDAGYLKNPDDE